MGCSAFLVLHAMWIKPIWFVAPVGLVIAAAAGAALRVLSGQVAPASFGAVGRGVASFGVAWLVLLPPIFITESGLRVGAAGPVEVAAGFFVPSAAVGAGLGWLAGRGPRAAGSGALAAVLLLIGPGHNIPFLAGTPAVARELSILAVVFAASSLTLVVVEKAALRRVARRRVARQSAGDPTR